MGSQRRFEEAIGHFRKALEISPAHPRIHKSWGDALRSLGRTDEALDHYRQEIGLNPNAPKSYNNAAWILATRADLAPDASSEAVRLAQRAVELAGRDDPGILDTLAAAHASAGNYDLAVATARRAITLATDAGAEKLAADIHERLSLYQQGKPFRMPR